MRVIKSTVFEPWSSASPSTEENRQPLKPTRKNENQVEEFIKYVSASNLVGHNAYSNKKGYNYQKVKRIKVISIDRIRGGYVLVTKITFFNNVKYYLLHETDENLKPRN